MNGGGVSMRVYFSSSATCSWFLYRNWKASWVSLLCSSCLLSNISIFLVNVPTSSTALPPLVACLPCLLVMCCVPAAKVGDEMWEHNLCPFSFMHGYFFDGRKDDVLQSYQLLLDQEPDSGVVLEVYLVYVDLACLTGLGLPSLPSNAQCLFNFSVGSLLKNASSFNMLPSFLCCYLLRGYGALVFVRHDTYMEEIKLIIWRFGTFAVIRGKSIDDEQCGSDMVVSDWLGGASPVAFGGRTQWLGFGGWVVMEV
ncbi:uncharacterized protein G2W53_015409 [Senna tora]|uniref:Uncharacterized protein n=1 Tax=Senna tora TaxID=362788 RepID=A0A834WV59_9FABA|nr:uncharacterized protein G2W53_015409 [Senna tora]